MNQYQIEKDWGDQQTGLRCVILGIWESAHRCGYVGIPESHPLFGVDSHQHTDLLKVSWARIQNEQVGKRSIIEIFCAANSTYVPTPAIIFDVHGSLTYSRDSSTDYPVKTDEKLWWFGFDCEHDGDAPDPSLKPSEYLRGRAGIIRTTEYVEAECVRLAQQLKQVEREIKLDRPPIEVVKEENNV